MRAEFLGSWEGQASVADDGKPDSDIESEVNYLQGIYILSEAIRNCNVVLLVWKCQNQMYELRCKAQFTASRFLKQFRSDGIDIESPFSFGQQFLPLLGTKLHITNGKCQTFGPLHVLVRKGCHPCPLQVLGSDVDWHSANGFAYVLEWY